nr:RDD family protein [Maliibacterium massiliense]
MTQKEFMEQLASALLGKMSAQDAHDVLAEYRAFFQQGLSEGKTEQEVARALGEPARIVQALLDRDLPPIAEKAPMRPASCWRRFAAFTVDCALSALPLLPLMMGAALYASFDVRIALRAVVGFVQSAHGAATPWIAAAPVAWQLAALLGLCWFFLLTPLCMWLCKGRSLGQRLLGVRVAARDGGPPTFMQCLLREWAGKLALNVICAYFWWPLGLLPTLASLVLCLITREGITVWDLLAGTRVLPAGKRKAG